MEVFNITSDPEQDKNVDSQIESDIVTRQKMRQIKIESEIDHKIERV